MNIEHRTLNDQHRIMNSVYFKKDFATRGASACAARAIPSFVIRYSTFDILRFAFLVLCSFIYGFGCQEGESINPETWTLTPETFSNGQHVLR